MHSDFVVSREPINEFADRIRVHRRMGHQDHRARRNYADGYKVARWHDRKFGVKIRVDRIGAVGAHQQRVTIGR